MTPAARFYALVTIATIAVMFVTLTWIVPTVESLSLHDLIDPSLRGCLWR